MDSKHILMSKTFWVNIISVAATLGSLFGFDLSPDEQAQLATAAVAILGVANLFLRKVTTGPVHVTKGE